MWGRFGDRDGGAMTGDGELFDSIKICFGLWTLMGHKD